MREFRIVTDDGETTRVYAPYHPKFVEKMHSMGAKWKNGAWESDILDADDFREAMMPIYYRTDEPCETVAVKIVAKSRMKEYGGAIFFADRMLCVASGRDSGAKLGDDVALVKGEIDSGGSLKNWTTVIKEGATFKLKEVPLAAVEHEIEAEKEIEEKRKNPEKYGLDEWSMPAERWDIRVIEAKARESMSDNEIIKVIRASGLKTIDELKQALKIQDE